MREQTGPKERILASAIRLFGGKGYAATSLREITSDAEVNLSMVNYYFGSKRGVLEAAFDLFLDRFEDVLNRTLESEGSAEERIRRFVRHLVAFYGANVDLTRVVLMQAPLVEPEIRSRQAERLRSIFAGAQRFLASIREDERRRVRLEIVGPAIGGLVAWHFLIRPIHQEVFNLTLDDHFYEQYADELADLLMYGLLGSSAAKSATPRQRGN